MSCGCRKSALGMNSWIAFGLPAASSSSVAIQSRDQSAKNTLSSNHAGNLDWAGFSGSKWYVGPAIAVRPGPPGIARGGVAHGKFGALVWGWYGHHSRAPVVGG